MKNSTAKNNKSPWLPLALALALPFLPAHERRQVGGGVAVPGAAIGLLATAFALVIGNVGATVVMVPMAINIALAVGGNPVAFALVVALSASNNFLSVSNPVLAMVTGPAGYRPRDLWRIGAPLTLVYLGVVLLVINLMF